MSYRNSGENAAFTPPVSSMVPGSLERSTGDIDLHWPGQHASMGQTLTSLFSQKDRLEFFCPREILFHGHGEDKPIRAASQDDIWGARFVWEYPAKKGERYVFTFSGTAALDAGTDTIPENIEMPDFVLVNGVCLHKRELDTPLNFTVEYIAPEDGPMEITLVKDRFYCIEHYDQVTNDWAPIAAAPTLHIYLHMTLDIGITCKHFGPTDQAPTTGEQFKLTEDMRTFYAPGPYRWVPDQESIPYDYPPVAKPDYPTANVHYNQFHDLYMEGWDLGLDPERKTGVAGNPVAIKDMIQMSLDNGIRCFMTRNDVLQAIEEMGLQNEPLTIEYGGGSVKRFGTRENVDENGNRVIRLNAMVNLPLSLPDGEELVMTPELERKCRETEGASIADVLRRFPNSQVVYRLNEFDGCQYLFITESKEDRARVGYRPWYDYAKIADEMNREAFDEIFAEARATAPDRFRVGANIGASGWTLSHPIHCGADFTINKTISRHQVNLLVAQSRGVNMAFGGWIGLQHDAWGALQYNHDSGMEIEAVFRSFFFNGGVFHDAEFQGMAMTADNKAAFNLKGMAWIKVTRMAAIHPRRGTQRAQIAFMRGSDNIWGWQYPGPGPHGLDSCDPNDPKEHVDHDLMDIVFPKFGDWVSFNPERWMTGTPYGPCDILAWDSPLDALKRYKAIVMLGANRVEEADWQHYIDYVKAGGRLVMGLYQLFPPTRERVYVKKDVSDLFGVKLGKDEPIWDLPSAVSREDFISQHYNKIELAGAEVLETMPNGDPLLTRFKLGDGEAYFFTTDRFNTTDDVAEKLVRSLFDPHVPVSLEPAHDWMETAISEKDDLRIIALMDHGRDCVPTDAGDDTGPYSGTVTLDLDNLGLPEGEYEVLQAVTDEKITKLETIPIAHAQNGRTIEVTIADMGSYAELVLGPKGKAEKLFFWG